MIMQNFCLLYVRSIILDERLYRDNGYCFHSLTSDQPEEPGDRNSVLRNKETHFPSVEESLRMGGPKTAKQLEYEGFSKSRISKEIRQKKNWISYVYIKEERDVRLYYLLDAHIDNLRKIAEEKQVYMPLYILDEIKSKAIEEVLSRYPNMELGWDWLESRVHFSMPSTTDKDRALKVAKQYGVTITVSGPPRFPPLGTRIR